ncbi:hypothetical protein GGR56DRAFT_620364 [Xylariaceae sp. FL0804]|nr:hypothetical protein GGR56DRAFT_620364 [Xylariaceae sp. FL0804]
MRFEDWDVLLFPKDSKVPVKEFKTSCHVIHDTEFAYTHGSFGLPTMTCFMPGLTPGTPFNISLHCWKTPEISQFTKNYSKHPELVKFEARVIVDGRLVASSSFHRGGPWPQLINHSFEFTKNGDLEMLRFPQFRSELLRQSYWSPADEVGRIKIVISEGFPRDSLTVPIERVKNVIAFSFQHAPLDILESSGIAWPNPAMWRRGPFNPTMPISSQHNDDGPDTHLHSPRRRSLAALIKPTTVPAAYGPAYNTVTLGSMPNTQALLHRGRKGPSPGYSDPFDQQKPEASAYLDWPTYLGPVGYTQITDASGSGYNPASGRQVTGSSKVSSSDASMPDYGKISSSDANMPDYGLSNAINTHHFSDLQTVSFPGANLEDPDIRNLAPKVPTNTPTATVDPSFEAGMEVNRLGTPGNTPPTNEFFSTNTNFSAELATSLTHSLLNQPQPLPVQGTNIPLPVPEIKSRKENRLAHDTPTEKTPVAERNDLRRVSQTELSSIDKDSRENSATNSSPSQRTFSGVFSHRSVSTGEFGHELTNMSNIFTNANTDPVMSSTMNTESRVGSGSDKGTKRTTRLFTPASAKAIDDEDEPRRGSPRVRIGFGEQLS